MKFKKVILLLSILGFFSPGYLWACQVCEKNQPEIFKGVTHGLGPQGNIDYIITWVAVIIVAITLFLSIKYLVKPNEDAEDHVKNIILEQKEL